MAKNIRLRLLSNIVIGYMMIAFAWWSVLLYLKNEDAFRSKVDNIALIMAAKKEVKNAAEFRNTVQYKELERKYKRQEWMIFGEGIVFIISLVIGVWLINRGYNEEMKAEQQRSNFLLSITHELKSPLASIRLILETFKKRDLEKGQIDKLSGSALQETERLHTLVNDLLLAARMETAYQPNPEMLDLQELIEDIFNKSKKRFPETTLHLDIQAADYKLFADKSGMTSVALNLVENAVKYSNEDAQINISLSQNDSDIIWQVADQGIGVSDKEKKKIFDRFYRVGNEDTRKTKGTGLGLYIVKEVIKAHNGRISIVNNRPKGSIFRIELPKGGITESIQNAK